MNERITQCNLLWLNVIEHLYSALLEIYSDYNAECYYERVYLASVCRQCTVCL